MSAVKSATRSMRQNRALRTNALRNGPPPHLITLADLTTQQITSLIQSAAAFKLICKETHPKGIMTTLDRRNVAMVFNKRSTRTRVAAETSIATLGGQPMFLGREDIQLGVNESLKDSVKVIGSMVDGILARVGSHHEIEALVEHSPVPIINALSDLYHPTQILADLLTMVETFAPFPPFELPTEKAHSSVLSHYRSTIDPVKTLTGKKVAWVGDTNNITNELLVTLPRFGMEMSVAAPKGYDKVDDRVWARVTEAKTEGLVKLTNTPSEALSNADIVITDTWISMGQEAEKADRLKSFAGYQITNSMVQDAGAKADWKFMHCLPRKQEEVDDEVFYGERSLAFPEAENRKWTMMAVLDSLVGRYSLPKVVEDRTPTQA